MKGVEVLSDTMSHKGKPCQTEAFSLAMTFLWTPLFIYFAMENWGFWEKPEISSHKENLIMRSAD